MAYLKKEDEREDELEPTGQGSREARAPIPPENKDGGTQLEDVVGVVLRYGSLLSMAIIVFGLIAVAWSTHTGGQAVSLTPPIGVSDQYTPGGLIDRVGSGDATAIISIGLLVLILTPVLRVASTVIYFFLKRDRTYLAVTGFVLLVLITGFLLGSTAG